MHAGNESNEHVIKTFVPDNGRGPQAELAFAVRNFRYSTVTPRGSKVARLPNTDARAVDPRDADGVGDIRAAIGVKHEPFFLHAVPNYSRVGSPIISRVAKERFWRYWPQLRRCGGDVADNERDGKKTG